MGLLILPLKTFFSLKESLGNHVLTKIYAKNFFIQIFYTKINITYINFLVTIKILIFLQNMLWKTCSKFNFKQLSHSMSVANMNIYARIQGKTVSLATGCSQ